VTPVAAKRRALGIWFAVLAPLWGTMAFCTYWEPVVRDGWSNVYWYTWHTLDWDGLWSLVEGGWRGSNPRLGQTVTTLLYAPGPYHVILTPLLELGLFWLMTTLALGRWPSLRRGEDALVFATVFALAALCTPQFGPMLFYRPFAGNYVFGLAVNLWWLVPYRLHLAAPRPRHVAWALPMLALGFVAGMCNEHTGPAMVALGLCSTVWARRRGDGVAPWMLAGLVGLLAGYLLMMLAPGHDLRYGGLARQAGIVERIVTRGLVDNLVVVARLGLYLVWALPWLVLGWLAGRGAAARDTVERSTRERIALWALAAAGLAITCTLLASPKLGPRLYLASIAFCAIALTGWLVSRARTRWARISAAVLAGIVLVYVEARCITTYARVGPIGAERLRLVQTSPKQTVVVVPRYPPTRSKWFIGEDFVADNLRAAIASDYYLKGVELAPAE